MYSCKLTVYTSTCQVITVHVIVILDGSVCDPECDATNGYCHNEACECNSGFDLNDDGFTCDGKIKYIIVSIYNFLLHFRKLVLSERFLHIDTQEAPLEHGSFITYYKYFMHYISCKLKCLKINIM